MTREEAIEYWEGLRKTFSSQLEQEGNHFGRMHLQTTIDAIDTALSALRQQEQEISDWICTLKCTALMEEGMCSHGGLCCLHESQRIIQEKEPLTLDELRKMDGEPVFLVDLVHKSDPKVPDLWGGWIVFTKHDQNGFIPRGVGFFSNDGYGKTWLSYRQKPKEIQK